MRYTTNYQCSPNAPPIFQSEMASTTPPPRKAVVVGAGPVGCLSAISLAKMGWTVEIYEGRPGTVNLVVSLLYEIKRPRI